jgi:hypothetical protein
MAADVAYFKMPLEWGRYYLWSQRAHDGWTHVYITFDGLRRLRG